MSNPQAAALPPARVSSKASSDYLAATLFLAVLFHAVLIMGVTFTAGEPPTDSDEATSLEVVILTSDYEQQTPASDAELLAERSLIGAGNTAEDVPVSVAYGERGEALQAGIPRDGSDKPEEPRGALSDNEILLYASNNAAAALQEPEPEQEILEQMRQGLSGNSNPTEIVADPSEQTLIRSNNPRELLISANTRESRIATYLEGWKRKIERVGTINFPETRGALRNPLLEVAVSDSGELKDVIVVRSSGDRQLDQAAVNILRMASPFEPFPDFLRRDYDVLRFSYEWYFTGDAQGAKLSVSP
jgi:periplasmic protein TonB